MKIIFKWLIFMGALGLLSGLLFSFLYKNKSFSLPKLKIQQALNKIGSTKRDSAIDHIIVIVMENKSNKDVIGNKDAPFINSLIRLFSYGDNYSAISHPSLPNYIGIIGGDTFGIKSDCNDCYVDTVSLVDQLEKSHKTWKAYMESMPSPCFIGNYDLYAQKHNPFIYFDNIRNNPKRCQNIVAFDSLKSDFNSIPTVPDFSWITPNLCNDMHDCSVSVGDRWLLNTVNLLLASPAFTEQKSLLVITWDENDGSGKNQVPILFVGSAVKKGFVSHVQYTHYSLLHTIENIWNLQPLTANVSKSNIISDVFVK